MLRRCCPASTSAWCADARARRRDRLCRNARVVDAGTPSAKASDSRGRFVDSMVEGAFARDGDAECVFIGRMSRDERNGAAYHWPHARRIAT